MKKALGQSLTAVGLVLILGFSGSLATQHEIKPGVERWPIKTSVLAGVDVSHGTPFAYADLVKLDDAPVGENGHRPQAARIPAFTNALGITEGDILTTTVGSIAWRARVTAITTSRSATAKARRRAV